jgi:hypothetical protein
MNRRGRGWLIFVVLSTGIACGNSSGPNNAPETLAGAGGGAGAGAGAGGIAGTLGNAGTAGTLPASGAGGSSAGAGAGGGGTAGSSAGVGQAGSSGASGSAGDGAGAGAGGVPQGCPIAPAPRLSSGTVMELPIEVTFGGAPLLFAEANPVPGGGMLTPLGVRFYVSEVALLRDGAEPLPVDVVTSTTTVAPYGVHFFNADDAASTTLRVLAPAGEYAGITFLWGLAHACNVLNPDGNMAPLSATSGMSWPHTGFLFFRYEGRVTFPGQGGAGEGGTSSAGMGGAGAGAPAGGAGAGGAGVAGGAGNPSSLYPPVIHMGGNLVEPLAPSIRIEGAFSVPAMGPVSKGLSVALDEIFEGALTDVDLTGFVAPPGPVGEEVLLGERLRRSMPELTVFAFDP